MVHGEKSNMKQHYVITILCVLALVGFASAAGVPVAHFYMNATESEPSGYAPVAGFTANATWSASPPLVVQFTDTRYKHSYFVALGHERWRWDTR